MPLTQESKAIVRLRKMGLLSSSKVQQILGVSQPTLSRLAQTGVIHRVGFGFYAHPDWEIAPQDVDFAIACARFGPTSAIGGLSALFHHGLLEQPP